MKKLKLLMILFASALGITKSVQASTIDVYPVPASINWNSVTVTTEAAGQGSSYRLWLKYLPAGDTMHRTTPTLYNFAIVQNAIVGLPAATTVQVWAVMVNGVDTVVSSPKLFTTDPQPHKAYIGTPQVVSSPQQTIVSFLYNVSLPTKFYVRYNQYMDTSSSVIVQPGSGSGQVILTSPHIPDSTYVGNFLRGTPVQAGVVSDSTIFFGAFTVPNWTSPDAVSLAFTAVAADSFKYTTTLVKGNASTATVIIRDLDSNGAVLATKTPITIYRDTVISAVRTGVPAKKYGQRVTIITLGGSDSITAFQRMMEVNSPKILAFDTFDLTKAAVSLQLTVATNGKPSWYSSTASVWLKYQDKYGNWITTTKQVVSGSTSNSTVQFIGLGNLVVNPGSNTVKGYIQNGAGLIDSQSFVFKLKPLDAAIPISSGWYIDAISSYEIGVKNINAGPGSFNLYAFRRIVGSGQVDTLLLRPNQVGYTLFPQRDTIGGCIGSTTYEVKIAAKNLDDVWSVTSPQQIQTIPAADPTFYIANAYTATQTSMVSKISGCGNGTRVYLEVQVFSLSNLLSPIATHSYGYLGTGNFSVFDSVYSLNPCTRYLVRALVHNGQYANQLTEERQVETKCAPTGIETTRSPWIVLFPNPVADVVSLESSDAIGEIVIFSTTTGQEVYCDTFPGMHADIQVRNLPKGNYVIQGVGFKKRFLKE